MKFKGNRVFVETDSSGEIVIVEGRARMKYRLEDTQIYSPSPRNLSELDAAEPTPTETPTKRQPSPKVPKNAVIAYTDGACSGNPGPAGLGYAVVFPDGKRVQRGEPLGTATNNIAELTAILRVLELVEDRSAKVVIHSDSTYAIGVLSKGWKAKANKELIFKTKRLLDQLPNATLKKVKGHAGVPENELVDRLARVAAETQQPVDE